MWFPDAAGADDVLPGGTPQESLLHLRAREPAASYVYGRRHAGAAL